MLYPSRNSAYSLLGIVDGKTYLITIRVSLTGTLLKKDTSAPPGSPGSIGVIPPHLKCRE